MTEETQAAQDTTTSAAAAVQSEVTAAPATDTPAPAAEAPAATSEDNGQPQGAPEQYADFTVPDGLEIDADVLSDFKVVAKELGLTQEAAQRLIGLQSGLMERMAAEHQRAVAEQFQRWSDDMRSDKEIGGDNYDAALTTSGKFVEKFGSPEFVALLEDSGLGKNPETIRTFFRAGKALMEDSLVQGGTQTTGKSLAERLWGTQ